MQNHLDIFLKQDTNRATKWHTAALVASMLTYYPKLLVKFIKLGILLLTLLSNRSELAMQMNTHLLLVSHFFFCIAQ